MKNKLIVVSLIIVAVAILVRVGIVRANAGTITEVCKTNGGILMDKNNCPGDSEKWTIGSGSSITTVPNVLFIDGGFFLMKNGIVKEYVEGVWISVDSLTLPSDLVLTLVKWNKDWFVDKDGHLYRYTGAGYEMVASPTL